MSDEITRGAFVELDGLLAVVVGLPGDDNVPDEHAALWFGDPPTTRRSEGGSGGARPEVWTVPLGLLDPVAARLCDVRH
jgi:hypothetical protein